MLSSKIPLLPILGLIALIAVIILSYKNGGMFMDQLLASAFIVSTIVLVRTMNRTH